MQQLLRFLRCPASITTCNPSGSHQIYDVKLQPTPKVKVNVLIAAQGNVLTADVGGLCGTNVVDLVGGTTCRR
jgi:hypothetical protein